MKIINLALFLVTTSIFITPVYADDSVFGGSGVSPMPINFNQAEMVSEHIIIQGNNLAVPSAVPAWDYSCDFLFKNITDKTLTVTMGFPFPIYEGDSNAFFRDFKLTVNDKPIAASRKKLAANPKLDLNYKDGYTWSMTFPASVTITTHHHYVTGVTTDIAENKWAQYVLKTGGLWHSGKIGRAQLEVIPHTPSRLCTELDPSIPADIAVQPTGMKIVGKSTDRKYVWDLKNWKPNKDLHLCIKTGRDFVHFSLLAPYMPTADNVVHASLDNLSLKKLNLLRNTVYAQYGKKFHDQNLQNYFAKQWWYVVNPNYSDKLLAEADKQLVDQVSKIEKSKVLSR